MNKEHEQDPMIPPGYGIDDDPFLFGFKPYRIDEYGCAVYLTRLGIDVVCETYEQALEYLDEVAN